MRRALFTVGLAIGLAALVDWTGMVVSEADAQMRKSPVRAITKAIRTNLRLARNVQLRIKPGQKLDVLALVADRAGRLLATGLSDGSARVWDLRRGIESLRLTGHAGGVTSLAVDAEGRVMAVGGGRGEISLYELPLGRMISRFAAHRGPVAALAMAPDGSALLSGGADGRVALWDPKSGNRLADLQTEGDDVTAAAVSGDGLFFVTGDEDGGIQIWDAGARKAGQKLAAHEDDVVSLTLDDFGARLVSVDEEGRIIIWDIQNGGRSLQDLKISGATVLSAAVSGDDRFVAIGDDDNLVRLHSLDSGKEERRFVGHAAEVRSVAFDPTNRYLHSASVDGTSRVWDIPTAEPVVTMVSSVAGWTVVDESSGQFDGSVDGAAAVEWRTTEGAFELDQFNDTHFQPGVLALALEGDATGGRTVKVITEGFSLPPTVKIEAGSGGKQTDVTVEITDEGGGISNVRLYHNGRLITEKTPGVESLGVEDDGDEQSHRFRVRLVARENHFKAVASNKDGIESAPSELIISGDAAAGKPVLHLLVIGINRYQNPNLNLNYGVPDAQGIARFFQTAQNQPYGEVRTYQLFNESATRRNILEHFGALSKSEPEDIVVIYMAGHGETVGDDFYFVPHDATRPDDPVQLAKQGFGAETMQEKIPEIGARKILIMIDACKSGAAVAAFRGFTERKSFRALSRTSGIHIVAAAGKDQFAAELPKLGHGVFTYSVLQALEGKADKSGDKLVSVDEINRYVATNVPSLSLELNGNVQHPMIERFGPDFGVSNVM